MSFYLVGPVLLLHRIIEADSDLDNVGNLQCAVANLTASEDDSVESERRALLDLPAWDLNVHLKFDLRSRY